MTVVQCASAAAELVYRHSFQENNLMIGTCVIRSLSFACLALFGFGQAHGQITHGVPIDIVSFADDNGTNQAVSATLVEQVFEQMNNIQYNEHHIHLVFDQLIVLNHTGHNNSGDVGQAKLYVDASVERTPWKLVAFFTDANIGGGVAWGGGLAPYGISYSDSGNSISGTELIMAHEVGHNLGLAHLDQYPVGSGMHFSDTDGEGNLLNPNNRMWGGTYFRDWQADIMMSQRYTVLLGDVNNDGAVDLLDVTPFVDLITSGEFATAGDVNLDGTVNLLDVERFVAVLVDG